MIRGFRRSHRSDIGIQKMPMPEKTESAPDDPPPIHSQLETSYSQPTPFDNPHRWADKADRVKRMFDRIARTYTLVNSVISFGQDAGWRRKAVLMADPLPGDRLLDVCCGPGEFADAFADHNPPPDRIVGLDFSAGMIEMAEQRQRRRDRLMELVQGDATDLPFEGGSFDTVCCAFGVRNLSDPATGLAEFARVLAPGGRVVILEFALPANRLLRWGYQLYFNHVLPRVGGLISGDRAAYAYLPRSVETFFQPADIADMLKAVGLVRVRQAPLTMGVAWSTVAEKPAAAEGP
jgi:demethylmenaquinone methyltransferase/2-methoxy-6-polyprenyl-1,4-benzoquinol methylase